MAEVPELAEHRRAVCELLRREKAAVLEGNVIEAERLTLERFAVGARFQAVTARAQLAAARQSDDVLPGEVAELEEELSVREVELKQLTAAMAQAAGQREDGQRSGRVELA